MQTHFERPSAAQLTTRLFDLIVVGGGITGAGIAQDAASRGMSVLLLEKGDFASGTSSKSTKLIHGGLRYLQNGQVGVVRESLSERQLQMLLAPHMVWSMPFVVPTFRGERKKNFMLGVGLWVYDLLAGFRNRRFHEKVSPERVAELCPGIDANRLTGGYVYEDCRTDDARHTLEVLKSAAEHGAVCINYAKVSGLVHDGCMCNGVVVSMMDRQGSWSQPFEVRGRAVVNATGVWTQAFATATGAKSDIQVVPAKGIHITVARESLPIESAMIVPSAHDSRFCFAVPWYDSILIGTTDTEYNGSLDDVRVERDEVMYVLDAVNALFPNAHLTESQVTGRFAGLRPLVKQAGKSNTKDLSRGHSLTVASDGVITIAGGKLTTYRPMAKSVVDKVVKMLPWARDKRPSKCRTHKLPLGGWSDLGSHRTAMDMFAIYLGFFGVEPTAAAFLPSVYGARTRDLVALLALHPELAEPLSPKHPYIAAQVWFAAQEEGALTVEDVLSRRIRLTITDEAEARKVAQKTAYLMGEVLNWDADTHKRQVEAFLEKVGA